MITDATDNTVNPSSKSNIEVVTVDSVANVDPLRDPQTQPRVLARQIPSSTARGQMQLGAPNIFTDSPGRRILTQDDNQVNVVSMGNIGLDSSGTQLWGLKVAQPGIDVTTATDSQLIFNSQQNVFKIVKTATLSVTTTAVAVGSSGSDSVSYTHNLGYTPAFVYYLDYTGPFSSAIYDPSSIGTFTGASGANQYAGFIDQINASVDNQNFTVTIYQSSVYWGANPGGNVNISQTFKFRFYLLQESASVIPPQPDTGSVL